MIAKCVVSALPLHHRRRTTHSQLRLCAALESLPPLFELSSPSGASGAIQAEMLGTLASFIEQFAAITRKFATPPVLVRYEVEQFLDRRLGRLLVQCYLAMLQEVHPVADVKHLRIVVGDQNHRNLTTLAQHGDQIEDNPTLLGPHGGERLIQ